METQLILEEGPLQASYASLYYTHINIYSGIEGGDNESGILCYSQSL